MLRGQDSCQDGLGHFFGKGFDNPGRIGPEKKYPRVPIWVRGEGGSNCYLGNAQMKGELFQFYFNLIVQWGVNWKPTSCGAWLYSVFWEEKTIWEHRGEKKKETLSEDDKEKWGVHELLEKKILDRTKRPKTILPENLKKTDKDRRKESIPKTIKRER